MIIFAIDDEPHSLSLLERAILTAEPDADLRTFQRASALLAAIEEQHAVPDVVFSDIEMPGASGMALALRIKRAAPDARIVFVTGYSEYAVEAFRLRASGYVLKPVTAERVREELDALPTEKPAAGDAPLPVPEESAAGGERRLVVRCFGYFEAYRDGGEPLMFGRKQTKEMLAFLIDREGAVCTADELMAALWGGEGDAGKCKAYLRALTQDLRQTLAELGMEKLLIRRYNQWAVRPELLDCDYYRMKNGDMDALNAYRGQYMEQYAWAERTRAMLAGNTEGGGEA